MRIQLSRLWLYIILAIIAGGCANVTMPTGGKKDTKPPKLLEISPEDSLLNTRVKRLDMRFNEYINISNASKEVQISPILAVPPTLTGSYKKATLRIVDSLLEDNTTYRISFGSAIVDFHEGNPFKDYTYTFSTGSYFDSLQISGEVINASTGLPDSGSIVMLYNASKNDTAVLREKPLYVGRVEAGGHFSIKGLPGRKFRIYALKESNNNLTYEGGDEWIGFTEKAVVAGDTNHIVLRTFKEIPDTSNFRKADSTAAPEVRTGRTRKPVAADNKKADLSYKVEVDTSNSVKRTQDLLKPLVIQFNRPVDSINKERIHLAFDSANVTEESATSIVLDTTNYDKLVLDVPWRENKVYTLRLLKGFAKDSAGNETMPAKFIFRTKNDDDYGKLNVHLPSKYADSKYLLMVSGEKDTVYCKPVTDTLIHLKRLEPGGYTMRIIVDANHNLMWDTGDLLAGRQAEPVIPYTKGPIAIKAGWDNTVDFEEKPQTPPKGGSLKGKNALPDRK